MNQNILLLLIVLMTVNVVLIGFIVIRSSLGRRRYRSGALPVTRRPLSNGVSSPIAPSTESFHAVGRIDGLTGLLIPSEWNRVVADEDARNHRYGHPTTVVVVEVEGLDRLAGAIGTAAIERILPAVADTLSRNARGADHLARLGPARFGILMPETGEVAAINYIERVREACDLWLESGAVALQLAIGWASPTADTSLTDALAVAHERMYTELRRNARRSVNLPVDSAPALHDIGGSPAPA